MPFPGSYMKLFNATAHAVKAVDSQIKVGGPATAQLQDVKQFHDLATAGGTYTVTECDRRVLARCG